MADAVEHLEVDVVVALGRVLRRDEAHEPVVLAVDEQRRALEGLGEVVVEAATQVEEERACRLGVRAGCLLVLEAFGGQRDEPAAKVGVET